jgi:hypothetical protein
LETTDRINPNHYKSHPSGVECITITEHMGFNLGNVIKYTWRADLKNGLEDLEKATWYLEREIAKRKKQEEKEKQDAVFAVPTPSPGAWAPLSESEMAEYLARDRLISILQHRQRSPTVVGSATE